LPEGLLGTIARRAAAPLLAIGIYRRRLPEQPYRDNLLVKVGRRTCACRASPDLPATDHHRAGRRRRRHRAVSAAAGSAAVRRLLLVYLLALAAGVLSHVPGGVGVFEAILLAAFADKLGAAPLAAALLLYRLIYVVLPLLVACVLLLINEGQRLFQTQTMRAASGLAAPILAVLVFLSGVVLLFSGATRKSTRAWNTSVF
jgi:phosphatidylglycerol lysyltransferase